MLVIDKLQLIEDTKDMIDVADLIDAIECAQPLANPVIDSVKLRRALIKEGFTLAQIKTIYEKICENSINYDMVEYLRNKK